MLRKQNFKCKLPNFPGRKFLGCTNDDIITIEIRKDELGLSQKLLADAIGVKLRTLQDWEIGRSPMPKPVEILMELMREMPDVKEKLLTSSQ